MRSEAMEQHTTHCAQTSGLIASCEASEWCRWRVIRVSRSSRHCCSLRPASDLFIPSLQGNPYVRLPHAHEFLFPSHSLHGRSEKQIACRLLSSSVKFRLRRGEIINRVTCAWQLRIIVPFRQVNKERSLAFSKLSKLEWRPFD